MSVGMVTDALQQITQLITIGFPPSGQRDAIGCLRARLEPDI